MDNNNGELKQFNMSNSEHKEERNTPEYLAQLLKDKKQIQAFPNVFIHVERILDEGKLLFYILNLRVLCVLLCRLCGFVLF